MDVRLFLALAREQMTINLYDYCKSATTTTHHTPKLNETIEQAGRPDLISSFLYCKGNVVSLCTHDTSTALPQPPLHSPPPVDKPPQKLRELLQYVRKITVRPHSRFAKPQGEREGIHSRIAARMPKRNQRSGYEFEGYCTTEDYISGNVWP